MERLTGAAELEATGGIYETADTVQRALALLPDYGFRGSDSALGTAFSGVAGGLAVIAVCVGACHLFRFFRKKGQAHE